MRRALAFVAVVAFAGAAEQPELQPAIAPAPSVAPTVPATTPAAPATTPAATPTAPTATATATDAARARIDGGAPPEIGAPPLAADARLRPLVPHEADDPRAGDDERLQRRLSERVHELDDRISSLGGARSARVAAPESGGALDEPRKRRDDAYAEFRRAAQDQASRARVAVADPLDATGAQAQERARAPIAAVNQLAVAECYKELAASPDGEADDLAKGQRALESVDAAMLPDSELPRLYYLRAWFLAEAARRADDAHRADAVARAKAAADEMRSRFPLSELSRAAKALTIGLDDAPPTGAAP